MKTRLVYIHGIQKKECTKEEGRKEGREEGVNGVNLDFSRITLIKINRLKNVTKMRIH